MEQLITAKTVGSYNSAAIQINKWQNKTAAEINDIIDTLEIVYWWYSTHAINLTNYTKVDTNMKSLKNAIRNI